MSIGIVVTLLVTLLGTYFNMGGGDLNSKKSWHPNTMKNQERVWKAEQAAAEEKKRILELQHERAAERDRAELNDLARRSKGAADDDNRLHWMYDKPDKKGQAEDYLLGKTIEKNYDQPEKSDDVIPAVARRVVGSSMITSAEDSQVDLVRKMREDPLLLVKERERAARAALLNNPLHRKRIAELLRKEQDQRKGNKVKKAKKKNKDLDSMLAAKLNALGGDKAVDVAALLASDDSSSSSETTDSDEKKKKKKKKKDKKSKKVKKSKGSKKDNVSDTSDDDNMRKKPRNKNDNKSSEKPAKVKQGKEYSLDNRHGESRKCTNDISDESDGIMKSRSSKKQVSENRKHKSRQRKRSETEKINNKKLKDYCLEFDIEPKDGKRDISEDKQYENDCAPSRKRSSSPSKLTKRRKQRTESSESDNKSYKSRKYNDREKRRHRSFSQDSGRAAKGKKYKDEKRKFRSLSTDSEVITKSKKHRKEHPEDWQSRDKKRKQRSRSQDSDAGAKNKRSRKESSEDRYYKDEKRKRRSVSQDSDTGDIKKRNRKGRSEDRQYIVEKRKERSISQDSYNQNKDKMKYRENIEDKRHKYEQSSRRRRDSSNDGKDKYEGTPEKRGRIEEEAGRGGRGGGGLSAEQMAARLAEMAAAGAERERARGRRVAEQRAAAAREQVAAARPAPRAALALPDSLEARLHSNRHYIQRSQAHMNEHFARR